MVGELTKVNTPETHPALGPMDQGTLLPNFLIFTAPKT